MKRSIFALLPIMKISNLKIGEVTKSVSTPKGLGNKFFSFLINYLRSFTEPIGLRDPRRSEAKS
jgi:hypothetical protein